MASIKKNYLFNFSLTLVNFIFPFLSFPYVSRVIGPSGIGKVQFVISLAQYFALFAALGIPIYGSREIAKSRSDERLMHRTFSELTIIYFITSMALSVVFLVMVLSVKFFHADATLYYYALLIVALGFSTLDWFYSGIEDFKTIAIRSFLTKLLSLGLLYLFVKEKTDILAYLLVSVFAILGNSVFNFITIWGKVKLVLINLNFKRHFKSLAYIFSTTLAASMYTLLDTVLLGFLANDVSVGFYTAGVKVAKISLPIVTSLAGVFMPKISQTVHEKRMGEFYEIIKKSFGFIMLVAVPITFGLFLMAREFTVLFSGKQFLGSVIIMQILSPLPVVIGLGMLFGIQILIATGKDREMFISICVGMVVSLILNFSLVPFFQEIGAAVANLASEILVTLTYIYFTRKYYQVKVSMKVVVHAVTASLTFVPIIYLSRMFFTETFIPITFTVLLCATSYFAIQFLVFKNELMTMLFTLAMNKLGIGKKNSGIDA